MNGLRDHAIVAALLAIGTIVLLIVTAPDIGLTWDEPAYIAASESYLAWLDQLVARPGEALGADAIRAYWTVNHEHPPLDKVWSGLVWRVARRVLDDLTAHRLGNMLLSGLLVGLLYGMVAVEGGRIAALAAALALITMPRLFFHAHLAALDVPGTLGVFAVVLLFWQARDRRGWGWDLALGGVWGIAMGIKVVALLAPAALGLWALFFRRERYLFRRLAVMGLVGLPLWLALWPWMYHEFLPRLAEYVLFCTVDHWPIGQFYLGRFTMPPPWHFGPAIVFAVLPPTLTLLASLGAVRALQGERRAFGGLLVLCTLTPALALVASRSTVYDNERLFMPLFPYLAALAGIGFGWLTRRLQGVVWIGNTGALRQAIPFLLGTACFLPQTIAAARLYPHLLSYYSASVGGLRGAARLGLETTYWCETYRAALPYLNAHADAGDVIWVEPWSHDVLLYYQQQGQLDPGLQLTWLPAGRSVLPDRGIAGTVAGIDAADYAVVQHRQTGFTRELRDWMRDRDPVYRLSHQGIPLLEIYARDAGGD